ncbi:MAG: sensor histidine kinase [Saprospiraceae bacterium]|nr:sensor histidine kinase [Saprospiraceae bacterium]
MKYLVCLYAFLFMCLSFDLYSNTTGMGKPETESQMSAQDSVLAITAQVIKLIDLGRDTCLVSLEKALRITDRCEKKTLYRAEVYQQLAYAEMQFGQLSRADSLLDISKVLFEENDWGKGVALVYLKKGSLSALRGLQEEEIRYQILALEYFEAEADHSNAYKPCINLATIFTRLDQSEKALLYIEKAEKHLKELEGYKDNYGYLYFLNTKLICFGDTLEKLSDKTLEVEVLNAANTSFNYYLNQMISLNEDMLSLSQKLESSEFKYRAILMESKIKGFQKDHNGAMDVLRDDYDDIMAQDNVLVKFYTNFYLARALKAQGDYSEALKYIQIAEKLNDQNEETFEKEKRYVLNMYYDIFTKQNRYKEALNIFEELTELRNQANSADRFKVVNELEAKYQKEKDKNEILMLSAQNSKLKLNQFLLITGFILMAAFLLVFMKYRRLSQEIEDNKKITQAILLGEENEKKRLASDLHDGLGQSMLILKNQYLQGDTNAIFKEDFDKLIQETRAISMNLHPAPLKLFGLTKALEDMVYKASLNQSIFSSHELTDIDAFVNEISSIQVFRIIQEAINNILKHSDATSLKLMANAKSNELELVLMDNGKGFEITAKNRESLGVTTMHERAEAIGGKLFVESIIGKGTTIRLNFPKAV